MSNKDLKNRASIFFLLTVCIFISLSLHLFNGDDDHFFGTALESRTLIEFLEWRYHTWTGRMLIEGLMVLTINHPWYWMVAIPLASVAVAASITILAGYRDNAIYITSFILCAVLVINHNVIMEAMWWVTGSYNYIQPIAAGLVSIVIHSRYQNCRKSLQFLSLILIVFSCFNEQFSVVVLIPYAILYTIFKKDYRFYNLLYLAFSVIFTTFSLTAPGNKARSIAETASWMPDYANLGLVEKVALGFDRLSTHISEQNIVFTSFILFISFFAIKKGKLNIPSLIAVFVLLFKAATFFVFTRYSETLNLFTHSDFLDFGAISNPTTFIPYIFSLIVLFSCIQIISTFCKDINDVMLLVLPFVLGSASVVLIGMSPTVYASGYRVLFVFNLSIIFIAATIARKPF